MISASTEILHAKGFGQLLATRLWNFGFDSCAMTKMVDSLPTRLRSAWMQCLDSLDRLERDTIANLQHLSSLTKPDKSKPSTIDTFETYPLEGQDIFLHSELEADLWDGLCGFIKVDFDSVSQNRQNVSVNAAAARFWDMDTKNFRQRFEEFTLPLPTSDLDAQRIFASELIGFEGDRAGRYIRLISDNGLHIRAELV